MRHLFSHDRLIRMRDWLKGKAPKGRVIPILALCFVIAISVAIGVLFYQGRLSRIAELEYFEYYGYPAVFVVSMIWNSTVLVPIPSFWIYYPLASIFFPPLVGLAGGAGAAIGELTAYMAGYSGRGFLQKRRMYARAERWVKRWGAIIVFVFNLVPLFPYDLTGIASGALRFPLRKFFLICLAGRTLAYTFVACAGAGWIPIMKVIQSVSIIVLAGVSTWLLLALGLVIESWTWRRTSVRQLWVRKLLLDPFDPPQ